MESIITDLLNKFLEFFTRYTYFLRISNIGSNIEKYSTVSGFIAGFVFVLAVFFSSVDENKKTGFFKVIPIIAIINSCGLILYYINALHQDIQFLELEKLLSAQDNIISGFIFTLVLCSCYRTYGGRAFLFGIATYAALPLLNFSTIEYLSEIKITLIVIRVVLAGFLCVIISHRQYFYTSWICYFGFYLLLRIISFATSLITTSKYGSRIDLSLYSFSAVKSYFSEVIPGTIVFVVILIFGIIFEKGVLYSQSVGENGI